MKSTKEKNISQPQIFQQSFYQKLTKRQLLEEVRTMSHKADNALALRYLAEVRLSKAKEQIQNLQKRIKELNSGINKQE